MSTYKEIAILIFALIIFPIIYISVLIHYITSILYLKEKQLFFSLLHEGKFDLLQVTIDHTQKFKNIIDIHLNTLHIVL